MSDDSQTLGLSKEKLKTQMERLYANSRAEILQRVREQLKAEDLTVEQLVRLVIRESYWRGAIDLVELEVPKVGYAPRTKPDRSFDVSGHR